MLHASQAARSPQRPEYARTLKCGIDQRGHEQRLGSSVRVPSEWWGGWGGWSPDRRSDHGVHSFSGSESGGTSAPERRSSGERAGALPLSSSIAPLYHFLSPLSPSPFLCRCECMCVCVCTQCLPHNNNFVNCESSLHRPRRLPEPRTSPLLRSTDGTHFRTLIWFVEVNVDFH